MHRDNFVKIFILLLGFILFCATTPVLGINGKVVEVRGGKAKIAYEGKYAPNVGDKVSIGFKIGGEFVPVEGEWKIIEVASDFVWAQAKGPGAGTPATDYLAVIETRSPRKKSDLNRAKEKGKGGRNIIPGLNASVTELRFYEGGKDTPPHDQRKYMARFPRANTRYISWEIHLKHPKPGRRIDFKVTAVYYRPDGTEMTEHSINTYLGADWTTSWHTSGWGWREPGNWEVGEYRADIFVKDQKVATGTFTVY